MNLKHTLLAMLLALSVITVNAQQKRIYLAADDHTDYMWTADEETYMDAILKMLDYYIDLNDRTAAEPYPYQSKWNCDGSYWMYLYSRHRSPEQMERLLEQIRQEKITVPRNTMISIMGVAPLEATLRDMYYSGEMERKYGLSFPIALSMEDQVLPLGLSSLWAGSGVKYSWRGVCACVTSVKGLDHRPHEVYWYTGLDGQKVMMKWYSVHPEMITKPNVFRYNLGKYLEADHIPHAIEDCKALLQDRSRYPYDAAAAFGKGGDALLTLTEDFPLMARAASDDEYQVIVSNEVDFFRDMEKNYGKVLPSESLSYGSTEWGTAVASMAELSAAVKRSVEKLRTAELMYTLVARKDSSFGKEFEDMRRRAWFACGLYYEHDWTADSPDITRRQRAEWQRRTAAALFEYVDTLYDRSLEALSSLIAGAPGTFFVLNPLGWTRTDYCDYAYDGPESISVVDLQSGNPVPWQFVEKNGKRHIRLLAADIPSMGYRTFAVKSGNCPSGEKPFTLGGECFESDGYRLVINRQGTITSLVDKKTGREYIKAADGLSANDLGKAKRTKGIKGSSLRLENTGAVSATVVAESFFPLKHSTRITLFNGIGRIEIENALEENFGNRIQTYAFSFDMDSPTVRTEEAGAILDVRQASQGGHYADSICRVDWVALNHFADMSDSRGGMVLSNRDAYFMKTGHSSIDTLDVKTPQLQVMVGGKVNSWLGIEYQDGESHFENSFALLPYSGGYSAARAMKTSLEHQNPLVAGKACGNVYGSSYSLVSVSDPDVLIWAVKPSEDGIENGVTVRLWNLSDADKKYTLNTGWKLDKAVETTHVETDIKPLKLKKGILTLQTGHRRIQTVRLSPGVTGNVTLNREGDRELWVSSLTKIARPVLENLAAGTLKKNMPYESLNDDPGNRCVSYLEAVGRTVCGIAPWLELGPDSTQEGKLREEFIGLVSQGLANAVNPESPDYLLFDGSSYGQPLVDAAFLAQGVLRAPEMIWGRLDENARKNLVTEWKRTRGIRPWENNWLLFASMIEAALLEFTGECDMERLMKGVRRFRDEWYKGDAWYGDGSDFHLDYYNSLVIHPMLTEVLRILEKHGIEGREFLPEQEKRLGRFAAELERMISPEGTYPVIGRSITYRFGSFHALADASLLHLLPAELSPAQVRSALTAVISRQLSMPGTFNEKGWLRSGFAGSQINMGEKYINTGSLYLCTAAFLPLGLPASDPFWASPAADWTSIKAWNGIDVGADHALP